MKALKTTICILLAAMALPACKKNDDKFAPLNTTDVYLVGTVPVNGHNLATLWKNGLGLPLSDGTSDALAKAVTLSGGIVYSAGYDGNTAAYWKGIAEVKLANSLKVPATDALVAKANAIAVTGNDVYVAGYLSNGDRNIAIYWKNGTPVTLSISDRTYFDAVATGIAIAGYDVYITGYESNLSKYIAVCWKNGTEIKLSGDNAGQALGITTSGSNVYISGYEVRGALNETIATYWKNGTEVNVPLSENVLVEQASAIAVVGNNVYLAGLFLLPASTSNYSTYWENGIQTPTQLSNNTYNNNEKEINDLPGSGIAIVGSDVYLTNPNNNPGYWKNGKWISINNTGSVCGIYVHTLGGGTIINESN